MSLLLLCYPWVISTDGYVRHEVGVPGQLSHKVTLKKEGSEEPENMWLGIPFRADQADAGQSANFLGKPEEGTSFNFVCEKPKGTTLNYKLKTEFPDDIEEDAEEGGWEPAIEIQAVWDDQGNRMPQDYPYKGGIPANAGFIPRTFFDRHDDHFVDYDKDYKELHKHEGKERPEAAIEELGLGTGGPQDVLVLGEAEPCKIADVFPVKIIGGFLMKLNEENGSPYNRWWKIFAVRHGDTRQWSDLSDDIAKARDYYENFEKDCAHCGNNTYEVEREIVAAQAISVLTSENEKFEETFGGLEDDDADFEGDDEEDRLFEM